MDKWIDVVTNPLGIAGFALFLVFTFVSRSQRPFERNLFMGLAAVVLLAGFGLAYRHASETPPAETKPAATQPDSKSAPTAQTETAPLEAKMPETLPPKLKQEAKADRGSTAFNIGGSVNNNEQHNKK